MKKPTGELAWLKRPPLLEVDVGVQVHLAEQDLILCQKIVDVHTDQVTWKPLPIVEGKIEL